MAQLEDEASAGPINGERWVPSQVNGAGETPIGVLGTPEPLLRLWRTWGVWQVPELDIQDAEALLELWPPGVSTHSQGPSLTLPGSPQTSQDSADS